MAVDNSDINTASAPAFDFDEELCKHSIVDNICLVKQKDGKLWPALKFKDIEELQGTIEEFAPKAEGAVRRIQAKVHTTWSKKLHSVTGGVAYLLRRNEIKWSILPISEEGMIFRFYSNIQTASSNHIGDEAFASALAIVNHRIKDECNSDGSDSDETASLKSVGRVCVKEEVKDINDGYALDFTGTDASFVDDNSDDFSDGVPPGFANNVAPAVEEEKKEHSMEEGISTQNTLTATKRKAPETDMTKTPRAKRASSAVTPTPTGVSQLEIEKKVSRIIANHEEPFTVITNEEALEILKLKFGVKVGGDDMTNYYLPTHEKPVATSLKLLRRDLCKNGLPESTSPLTMNEKVDIARWVRYAHVAGLTDGQTIDPDIDFGLESFSFTDAWKILRKFGCTRRSGGRFLVPASPNGTDKVLFTDCGLRNHFARYGVQCLPECDSQQDVLSKKDRLSLEIYFASPPYDALNTFERIGAERIRRRGRSQISYAEE